MGVTYAPHATVQNTPEALVEQPSGVDAGTTSGVEVGIDGTGNESARREDK
jgi:hypothetical protein